MPKPNPLKHLIPGIGLFTINLDAFTTSGLHIWLNNLLRDPHQRNHPITQTITTEIAKRNLN